MSYMRLRPASQAERREMYSEQNNKPLMRYFIATRPVCE